MGKVNKDIPNVKILDPIYGRGTCSENILLRKQEKRYKPSKLEIRISKLRSKSDKCWLCPKFASAIHPSCKRCSHLALMLGKK